MLIKSRLTLVFSSLLIIAITIFHYTRWTTINNEKILFRAESPDKTIIKVIDDSNKQQRCLIFQTPVQSSRESCISKNQPYKLVFGYYQLLSQLFLYSKSPENILVLGLGGGTFVQTLSRFYPQATIETVEVSDIVINLAKTYFDFSENERMIIHQADGADFIEKQLNEKTKTYDIIVLDAFDGDYIPKHLRSEQFLARLKGLMTPQGIVAANVFAYRSDYKLQKALFSRQFRHVVIGSHQICSNHIFFGSEQPLEISSRNLENQQDFLEKFHQLEVQTQLMTFVQRDRA